MYDLTDQQKSNLDRLATYLENLPENYSHFGMSSFLAADDKTPDESQDFSPYFDQVVKYALHNGGVAECGSIACAVGHGPSAGILFDESMIEPNHFYRYYGGGRMAHRDRNMPNWGAYTKANFCNLDGYPFTWMFGERWAWVDNTHRGAAARIRCMLAERTLPSSFLEKGEPDEDTPSYYAEFLIVGDAHIKPKRPA